uniref:Retrotransposon gag domain-containing protein n=1 Tax=Moniliophthora roreri TaxID=221103 RepID=A0A0W0GBP1_MONRR
MDYKPNQYQTPSPLLEKQPPTETSREQSGTRRILTLLFTTPGSEENESEGNTSLPTSKKKDLNTSTTSLLSVEEQDLFKKLLEALKNSPRLKKQPPIEEIAKEKKPSGSRPKSEPEPKGTMIGATVPVQVVVAEKEVKAALPRTFTGQRKEVKRFLREVLLYITLNLKTFANDRTKKHFLLSCMMDGPEEFWKNEKTNLLLAYNSEAKKTSFEPLDTALEAQMKLRDLKMKERANEYTYQFTYLANQMEYNNAAQIEAFKRELPKSLMMKIMTRLEGKLDMIKE